MEKIAKYEILADLQRAGNKSGLVAAIADVYVLHLTDFVRYCCDQLESTGNVKERQVYRSVRHQALERIEDLLIPGLDN